MMEQTTLQALHNIVYNLDLIQRHLSALVGMVAIPTTVAMLAFAVNQIFQFLDRLTGRSQ